MHPKPYKPISISTVYNGRLCILRLLVFGSRCDVICSLFGTTMCLQQGSGLEIDDTKFKQGFNVHMNSGLFIYDGTGCGAVLIFGVWFSGKGEWEKRVLRHRLTRAFPKPHPQTACLTWPCQVSVEISRVLKCAITFLIARFFAASTVAFVLMVFTL